VKNLTPEAVEAAKKDLEARHEVLYVREEKD
jgi:hypothetical protein